MRRATHSTAHRKLVSFGATDCPDNRVPMIPEFFQLLRRFDGETPPSGFAAVPTLALPGFGFAIDEAVIVIRIQHEEARWLALLFVAKINQHEEIAVAQRLYRLPCFSLPALHLDARDVLALGDDIDVLAVAQG